MKKRLTQKQRIFLIISYCILVLILGITFINLRTKEPTEKLTAQEIENYLDVKEEDQSLGNETIGGDVTFLSSAIPDFEERVTVYKTNNYPDPEVEHQLKLELQLEYENYYEYEDKNWILVKETDTQKYTLGSKVHKASDSVIDNISSSVIKDVAIGFLREQLDLQLNQESLTCNVETKEGYYTFTCEKIVNNRKVIHNFGTVKPITVHINNKLEPFFIQLSHLDLLHTTQVNSPKILTAEDLLNLTIRQINQLGNISLISLGLDTETSDEDHSHPITYTGEIESTKIQSIELAYQKKDTEEETLLIPIFILKGKAQTNLHETVYVTIFYPAISSMQ